MGTTLDVRVARPLAQGDVVALCAELTLQLRAAAVDRVVCDAGSLPADLESVDLLARLALTARRGGAGLHLRGVSAELAPLLVLVGLDDVLEVPSAAGSTCLRWPAGQRGGDG